MDMTIKSTVILVGIIIMLFAGGLFLIIQDSNRRQVAYDTMQQYLTSTDAREQAQLEAKIKEIIDKPPLVQTSKASLDSWDQFLGAALECNSKAAGLHQLDPTRNVDVEWKKCLDERLAQ